MIEKIELQEQKLQAIPARFSHKYHRTYREPETFIKQTRVCGVSKGSGGFNQRMPHIPRTSNKTFSN